MYKSSIDFIKIGLIVSYNDKKYLVKSNNGEAVILKLLKSNKTIKVPFYNCNKIKNEDGAYF